MFLIEIVDKIKTHILCSTIFFSENRAVFETKWQNMVEPDRPQTIIRRMRFAFWISKATNTESGYVTLTAFPLQQWLRERASILRYTYIGCLV
jgi:hypothetical protein